MAVTFINTFLFFSPSSLSPVAWYDPSDLSTLWQDDGTTPVTTDGQSVYRMDDKSGNGNHYRQATEAARPLYKTGGGLSWLLFDGTDDFLAGPALSALITNSTYEMAVAGRFASVATNNVAGYANPSMFCDADGYAVFAYARSSGLIGADNYDGTDDAVTTAYTVGTDFVWQQRHEGGTLYGRLNAGSDVSTASGNTGSLTNAIRIGIGYAGAYPLNGRFYGAVFKKTVFSTQQRSDIARWLAAKSGVSL